METNLYRWAKIRQLPQILTLGNKSSRISLTSLIKRDLTVNPNSSHTSTILFAQQWLPLIPTSSSHLSQMK
jgi:hypothetical protein